MCVCTVCIIPSIIPSNCCTVCLYDIGFACIANQVKVVYVGVHQRVIHNNPRCCLWADCTYPVPRYLGSRTHDVSTASSSPRCFGVFTSAAACYQFATVSGGCGSSVCAPRGPSLSGAGTSCVQPSSGGGVCTIPVHVYMQADPCRG